MNMEVKSLYDCIVKAKNNDKESMLALCQKFEPLLKKYSWLLSYEDAYNDLMETFLHIIIKIPIEKKQFHEDKYILSYIKNSIYHEFIQLNKKQEEYENKICFLKEETAFDNILIDESFNDSVKDILFFIDIKQYLTKKEWMLLKLKIVDGFSDGEIAVMLHISRQAENKQINKMKKKLTTFLVFREKRN